MGQEMKKEILILAGPSAVGKSTVAERILASGEFSLVRSFTTRERRGDGHDGEYFYVTDDTFSRMAEEGAFVEQSEIAGHRYGTPRSEIGRIKGEGKKSLLILDQNGVRSFRESRYAAVTYAVYLYGDLNVMEERLYARELSGAPSVDALLRFTARKEGNIAEYLAAHTLPSLFDLITPCDDAAACAERILHAMKDGAEQSEEEKQAVVKAMIAAAEEKKNYRIH